MEAKPEEHLKADGLPDTEDDSLLPMPSLPPPTLPPPSLLPPPVPKSRPIRSTTVEAQARPAGNHLPIAIAPPPVPPSRPQRQLTDGSERSVMASSVSKQGMLANPAFTTFAEEWDAFPDQTNSNNSACTGDASQVPVDDRPRVPTVPQRKAPPLPAARSSIVGPDTSLLDMDAEAQMPSAVPPPVPPSRPSRPLTHDTSVSVATCNAASEEDGSPISITTAAPPPLPARPKVGPL